MSSLVGFIWMPIMSYLSRYNEYEADSYATSVSNKKDLINALLQLVKENKSFPRSHPLTIFFYYSHPPILERLKALGWHGDNESRIVGFLDK